MSVANDASGRKLKFLRRIPIDPMTGSDEWGMRAYQDKPDTTQLGRAERLRCVQPVGRHRAGRHEVSRLVARGQAGGPEGQVQQAGCRQAGRQVGMRLRKLPERGFTLIEVLIVVTLVVILASIGMATYTNSVHRAREAVLSEDLFRMRDAIDQFLCRQEQVSAIACRIW